MNTYTCQHCHQEFQGHPSNNPKHCSYACYHASLKRIDDKLVAALYLKQSLSMKAIADQLGVSIGGIFKSLKRSNIETHSRLGSGRRGKSQGYYKTPAGYIKRYAPEHREAKPNSPYVFEHRLVMEKKLGRPLVPGELVHHINHDKTDNRPENLMLVKGNGEHARLHTTGQWSRMHAQCIECGTTKNRHGAHGLCIICYNRSRRHDKNQRS